MGKIPISALLVALVTPTVAWANDVPVYIYWYGIKPDAVLLSVGGGAQPLKHFGENTFYGMIRIPPGPPQRRTITVRYGYYAHAFDVQVIPVQANISISVNHTAQHSCTRTRVREAAKTSPNLDTAIRRSVNAGELSEIPAPNECDKNLRFEALQAAVRQNRDMRKLSDGLFLINGQIKDEYEAAAERGEGTFRSSWPPTTVRTGSSKWSG